MRKYQVDQGISRGELRFNWYPRGNFVITAQGLPARAWETLMEALQIAERMFVEANPQRTRPWMTPTTVSMSMETPSYRSWRSPAAAPQEYEVSGTGAEAGSESPSLPSYEAMTGVYPENRGPGREVPTDAGVENPLR